MVECLLGLTAAILPLRLAGCNDGSPVGRGKRLHLYWHRMRGCCVNTAVPTGDGRREEVPARLGTG